MWDELLLCKATGEPILFLAEEKLFGATLGDSPTIVPLSGKAIRMIPQSAMKSVPGDPDFPVFIHEGFAQCDGNGDYLEEGFHLGKFQFAISHASAQKFLGLHLKSAHAAKNGREAWGNFHEVT
jgi:hypothetical protein